MVVILRFRPPPDLHSSAAAPTADRILPKSLAFASPMGSKKPRGRSFPPPSSAKEVELVALRVRAWGREGIIAEGRERSRW
ncbi:hypothetical protein NL676_018111 [Syzygium grande]|nr:hypothetical protein NL676_018111 [Syzygium grande]